MASSSVSLPARTRSSSYCWYAATHVAAAARSAAIFSGAMSDVSWIVSRLARQEYHDVLSGLRVVSGPLARSVEIGSNGFQVETEFNLTAAYLRAV